MEHFPALSIGDDVRAQERLLRERFGIGKLALVVGGSMGAQQVYEWAVRFPDKVRRAAPIAGTAKITPHNAIFVESFIEAITSDPGFRSSYSACEQVGAGLARHARAFSVMGSPPSSGSRRRGVASASSRPRSSRPASWRPTSVPWTPTT